MEERTGEAFAKDSHLTVIGSKLPPGGTAPDFRLDYLDLIKMTIQSARLADSAGMVRLLTVVNSLERPVCQQVTLR
jgi:peroxiredoxin